MRTLLVNGVHGGGGGDLVGIVEELHLISIHFHFSKFAVKR